MGWKLQHNDILKQPNSSLFGSVMQIDSLFRDTLTEDSLYEDIVT